MADFYTVVARRQSGQKHLLYQIELGGDISSLQYIGAAVNNYVSPSTCVCFTYRLHGQFDPAIAYRRIPGSIGNVHAVFEPKHPSPCGKNNVFLSVVVLFIGSWFSDQWVLDEWIAQARSSEFKGGNFHFFSAVADYLCNIPVWRCNSGMASGCWP